MEREDVERMMDYIAHNGALHEYPECPEDDTCDCKFRDTNASVTVCCKFLHDAPARIAALETALAAEREAVRVLGLELWWWNYYHSDHDEICSAKVSRNANPIAAAAVNNKETE